MVPDRLSDAWFPSCSSRSTINYSNVARDAQVPRQTVVQWYEVLRDTLIAFELPAWPRTVKRKAIETATFYFFDTGVVRALRRLPWVSDASADFGEFVEHYVLLELRAWIDYRKPRTPLASWRSRSEIERGIKPGSTQALSRIAAALGPTIDTLVIFGRDEFRPCPRRQSRISPAGADGDVRPRSRRQ